MRVQRVPLGNANEVTFDLLDENNHPVPVVSGFMRHLRARGCSPNTLAAYAYDLQHFLTFLHEQHLTYQAFTPAQAVRLLDYLTTLPSRKSARRLGLVLSTTTEEGASTTHLSSATVNRILAAVSSFYEYLILAGQWTGGENPIQKIDDPALAQVSERPRPFLGRVSRQQPIRRALRVKTIQPLPRPMEEEHIHQLLESLTLQRDRAMLLLMLHGGLRPGEVLNLHLEDIQYGRKRVVIRYRTDHPKRVRTKSRTERVVDLHESATLEAVNAYVLHERPQETESCFVFLVGGHGRRRTEPLGYHALVKLFARHCERLLIRTPWVTPHALRHTHATTLWEHGMRELTLQKRLGHASPESTRLYTRVSDPEVVADYRRALGAEATE